MMAPPNEPSGEPAEQVKNASRHHQPVDKLFAGRAIPISPAIQTWHACAPIPVLLLDLAGNPEQAVLVLSVGTS